MRLAALGPVPARNMQNRTAGFAEPPCITCGESYGQSGRRGVLTGEEN
jgi:hypothetical protein